MSSADTRRDDPFWYKQAVSSTTVHLQVVPYARVLRQNATNRHSRNRARERIYEGLELLNSRAAVAALENAGVGIARLNATKSIIDTFVSRLSKDRPMPSFGVTDASWEIKRRAKRYREFIVGKMLETEYDDLARDQLLDSAIIGNGFIRIDDGENDVFAERIPVNEILFDDRECRYGKPQQAIRCWRVSRDYLMELFPEHKAKIREAPDSVSRPDDSSYDRSSLGDLSEYVDVFEPWHLPTTCDSKNGRHGLCLENVTLVYEEWETPRFPWTHLRLFKPREGFWGHGFVDQLASLQHRVNCIVRDLQLNIAATGRGHFLVNEQNDIDTALLTGWQPFKLKFKGGQPPTYVAPQMFNPAQLQALEFFIQKMYDLTGVSMAAATSKSSLGAGASGIALDTQYDIDSDRFRMPQANYARSRLDAAQLFIDAAERVAKKRKTDKDRKKRSYVAVSWKNRDAIEKLDYDKVKLEEGSYRLQIEATNFLPDTRAGKLSVVEQLSKAGVIPQWMVPALFDEPDIVQANNIMLAAYHNALQKMDDLADPDLPMPIPEAHNDLDLELKIAIAFFNRVQEEKAPPEIQDRFKQYCDMVTAAIAAKNKPSINDPQPPMSPAMPPMPGAVPAMPQGPVPAPTPIGAPPMPVV